METQIPYSNKTREILSLNPDAYASFVVRQAGPVEARKLLGSISAGEILIQHSKVSDPANAMLAGLWLWHDFLDESHSISQKIENPTGSFWHAIMHRREGDFWNSKYWLRKCQNHPAIGIIQKSEPSYDPFLFVDQCEQASNRSSSTETQKLIDLQRVEWKTLFEWCAGEMMRG